MNPFSAAIAAELVVVIAIVFMAAIVVNGNAISTAVQAWVN